MKKSRKKNKIYRFTGILVFLAFLFTAGCGTVTEKTEGETDLPEKTGDHVEKEVQKEIPLVDNKAIYEEDDETSVVTMYLTVKQGNEADHTNHTWTEVNTYSAYYYADHGLERYNCDAILQVGDENGPVEGEFGYGEAVPNAAVQVRGQSSSRSRQKNYKVRIKEGKGSWRGQRTLALNKHGADPVRFRNKLAYDLMKEIPRMMSARTQFVHLYVKDETKGGNGEFTDYGLYTQVEQMNRTYLKNHGLDHKGHLYKVNFFEWLVYDAVMKKETDADYDEAEFEHYIEIKGDHDHSKIQNTITEVNDYTIPIEEVLEKHFDTQNICYWIAFQLLIGNYDVGARNSYLYSPLNSEKWYIISWDNDASFSRTYYSFKQYSEGDSWERGITQFTHITLFNRMFREKKYRDELSAAIKDVRENYLTKEKVTALVQAYQNVTRPYLLREPDSRFARLDETEYETVIHGMPSEVDLNYSYYLESLEKPWPFYVAVPTVSDGQMEILWEAAYDPDGEDITYSFMLAPDYKFEKVLVEKQGIRLPEMVCDMLPPGQYFIRVRAKNESGYEQDCYDYYSSENDGKVYGAKCFYISEDGTISEHENVIERN